MRRDCLLPALALLVVVAVAISPAGARMRGVAHSDDAHRVDGISAAGSPRARHLAPLDRSGKLPASTVPRGRVMRGPRGEAGPAGLRGERGKPAASGPETAAMHFSGKPVVTRNSGQAMFVADGLPPGTYLALSTTQLEQPLGETGDETLAGCEPRAGAVHGISTGIEIGARTTGGELTGTAVGFGVFGSDRPQDIVLYCGSNSSGATTFFDSRLIVARIPSAWAQVFPG